jgi:hypothetical protein
MTGFRSIGNQWRIGVVGRQFSSSSLPLWAIGFTGLAATTAETGYMQSDQIFCFCHGRHVSRRH